MLCNRRRLTIKRTAIISIEEISEYISKGICTWSIMTKREGMFVDHTKDPSTSKYGHSVYNGAIKEISQIIKNFVTLNMTRTVHYKDPHRIY